MNPHVHVRKGYADSRMGQLHYVEAGSGPALVLIPHSGRSSSMYHDLIRLLAVRYRVVVFDVPGCGLSVQPPRDHVSVADLADCFMDAIDFLRIERFGLFGLHGGNKIGASMVVRHPGRIAGFIYAGQSHSIVVSREKRTAVFDATPCISSVASTAEALADDPAMWAREFVDLTGIWWSGEAARQLPQAARHRLVERAVDSLLAFEWRPFFYQATYAYDMEADLRRIAVATLVLELATPAEDRSVGRQGEALLRTIPGARLVTMEFPDAFVITLEDRPREVAAVIDDFLGGLADQAAA